MHGVLTMDEKVANRLRHLLAKRTQTAIYPPPLLKPVHGPNPILSKEPCEELDLGRGPSLPHRLMKGGESGAKKLQFIGRLGRLLPICRELPRYIIGDLLV
jgi:hypothetical protein